MKISLLLNIIIIGIVLLAGCASNTDYSEVNHNLLQENWMRQVNLNPGKWVKNADIWFFTGNPNRSERYANKAPRDKAMSIVAVKVPQFTHIKVEGCFQVQIIGEQDRNSVFVLGTNAAVQQTSVQIEGNTICITQSKDGSASIPELNNVIVRIGVHNLRGLAVSGSAKVEGRHILSDRLVIDSSNADSVLLNGDMNLVKVNNTGIGTVSVMGAYTPNLQIQDTGNGTVNVSGHVGIQHINHRGDGTVSIIGADTCSLTVYASGSGLTTVAGYMNLKRVEAADKSQVYLYWVDSRNASIKACDEARIGLAGAAANLTVHLSGGSRFDGRYLRGNNVYVHTEQNAHANVMTDHKMFAAAYDQSSIYFYGPLKNVSRFATNSAVVLPVQDTTSFSMPPQIAMRRMSYK
ncbi:MAG: hypothetical protein ACD_60C00162G0012 [uncultured bacterium]|nr:MAG: hypothetical protein ACD_60C00162G0012 [uncultured bacterium]